MRRRAPALLWHVGCPVVVAAFALVHARFIGHYPVLGTSRTPFEVGFVVVLWVVGYAVGLPEATDAPLLATVGALVTALVVVSVAALAAGEPLLPRFVLGGSVLALVPVGVLAGALGRRSGDGAALEAVATLLEPCERADLESDVAFARRPLRLAGDVLEPAEIAALGADVVVLGRRALLDEALLAEIATLHRRGLRVRTLADLYDQWIGMAHPSAAGPLVAMPDLAERRSAYARSKRVIDVVFALGGLLACALVVPVVAVLDLCGNRGPLLFRQRRTGKDGIEFVLVKFRTMPPSGDSTTWTAPADPRVGRVGAFLRRTHLDEAPQFWNVLRGEMSLVGPRPEQPAHVERLRAEVPFYDVRHLVRPGLTGWAQVCAPYAASTDDAARKLRLDLWYVRHQSLGLDLRIIGRTLRAVVGRKGR